LAGFGLDFGRLDDLRSIHLFHANTALFRFQLNGFSVTIQIQVTDEGSILQRARKQRTDVQIAYSCLTRCAWA
jgi:hypothetical protein